MTLWALLGGVLLSVPAYGQLKVITVPQSVQNLSIPHYTTWDRTTRLKAIARGGNGTYLVEWDFDGDLRYDFSFTTTNRYDLSTTYRYANVTGADTSITRLFVANVRVTSGAETSIASYPVAAFADVSITAMAANPLTYSEEKVNILRQIAIDDALWWGHNQMISRTGEGTNVISGYVNHRPIYNGFDHGYRAANGAFVWAMGLNGHFPAYPPGKYNDYGVAPPEGWRQLNDTRYNHDPYAEDTMRVVNFLLGQAQVVNLANPSVAEADDLVGGLTPNGYLPIPGTNNNQGIRWQSGFSYVNGHVIPAMAVVGLGGTMAQAGPSGVVGKSFEYIVQEAVDFATDGMNDANSGWDYYPNTSRYDGSTTQWMYFGIEASKRVMKDHGVYLNNYAHRMTAESQVCGQGTSHTAINGFNYGGGSGCVSSGGSLNLTGGGLVGSAVLDWEDTSKFNCTDGHATETPYTPQTSLTRCNSRTRYDAFVTWLANNFNAHWNDSNYNSGSQTAGRMYAIYSTMKGARAVQPELTMFGTHDWYRKFSVYLIRAQYSDGRYESSDGYISYYYTGTDLNTYYAVMTATPSIFMPDPVALGKARPMTVLEGCAGQGNGEVTFEHKDSFHTDPSRSIIRYQWDFDDSDGLDWVNPDFETPDPNASVKHIYEFAGVYTATLRVYDNSTPMREDTFTISGITVTPSANVAPSVSAGGPYQINVGDNLALNATGYDGNLACGDVLTYVWDIDGDNDYNDGVTGEDPVVPWAAISALPVGVRNNVCVRVTDEAGSTGQACGILYIYNKTPVACFTANPNPAFCQQQVNFDGACSSSPDPRRRITRWDWDWTGDMNADQQGNPVTHAFGTIGQHTVTLWVTDDAGNKSLPVSHQVTVEATMPPIAIAGGPYVGEVGRSVRFDGSASWDPDRNCGDSIVTYAWDFDLSDGAQYTDAVGPTSTVVAPWDGVLDQLAYPADPVTGLPSNTIGLKVTDSTGLTATATATLIIYSSIPTASFTALPMMAACLQPVHFDATSSRPSSPAFPIVLYEWDFNSDQIYDAQGAVIDHDFDSFGEYNVTLRVTDSRGRQNTSEETVVFVQAGNLNPVANAGGPYSMVQGQLQTLTLDGSRSTDPDQECGDQITSYIWDLNGNGFDDDLASPNPTLVLTWAQLIAAAPDLVYPADPRTGIPRNTIGLKAIDSQGGAGTTTTTLTIYGSTPVAVANVVPNPVQLSMGRCEGTFTADCSGSYAGSPGHRITSCEWFFNTPPPGIPDSQGTSVSYMETINGCQPDQVEEMTYYLRVTDDLHNTATAEFTVSFVAQICAPPYADADPGVPEVGYHVLEGENVTLNGGTSRPGDRECFVKVCWDWDGDGVDDSCSERPNSNGDGVLNCTDVPAPAMSLQLTAAQLAGLPVDTAVPVRLSLWSTCGGLNGNITRDTTTLTVHSEGVVAVAAASPMNAACGQIVEFNGNGSYHTFPSGVLTSYAWDFGSGFNTTGPVVTHAFHEYGEYQVTLRVRDSLGRSDTDTVTVTINQGNLVPVAVAGGPYQVLEGQPLVLDASASHDPNENCGDSIETYTWVIDGITYETDQPTLTLPLAATEGWELNEPHTVRLRVTDEFGLFIEATTTAMLVENQPIAEFTAVPSTTGCGWEVSFDASRSRHTRPDGRIVTYRWDWDSSDGLNYDLEETDPWTTHAFDQFGVHTVTLQVVDNSPNPAQTDEFSMDITVELGNQAPVANAGGSVYSDVGEPLTLDGSRSIDPNTDCGDTLTYEWDLNGNGQYEEGITSPNPVLVLDWDRVVSLGLGQAADPQTLEPHYPINLKVTDSFGRSSVATANLYFFSGSPVAVPLAVPMQAGCGAEIEFDGRSSYHPRPDRMIVSYSWDFDITFDSDGDGIPDNDVESELAVATYVYQWEPGREVGGPHQAQLTVTDDQDNEGSDTVTVTITLPQQPPIAEAGGPYVTAIVAGTPFPVVLDGGQSRDPVPTCDGIERYEWDLNMDNTPDVVTGGPQCLLDGGMCQRFEYINANWQVGVTQTIQLRVTDTQGLVSPWDTATIEVLDKLPPMVEVLYPNGREFLRGQVWVNYRASYQTGGNVRVVATMEGQQIGQTNLNLPAGGGWTTCQDGGCALQLDTTRFVDKYASYVVTITVYDDVLGLHNMDISNGPFTIDNTPPELVVDPKTLQLEQANLNGTPATINALATDNLDGNPRVTFNPVRDLYPLGRTVVTVTATDHAGNTDTELVDITVVDTTDPILDAGTDITVEAQSPNGTNVLITPVMSDICDANLDMVLSNEGPFFLGDAVTVTVTVTDSSGNSATDQVSVMVIDTTAPSILLPTDVLEVEQLNAEGTPRELAGLPDPILSDNGYPADQIEWGIIAPDVFPPGETVVTYWARDPEGNETQVTLLVIVGDNAAPVITVISAPEGLIGQDGTVVFTVTDTGTVNPTVTMTPSPSGNIQRNGITYTGVFTQEGVYYIDIMAADDAGNNTHDRSVMFVIDKTPPAVNYPRFRDAGYDLLPETQDECNGCLIYFEAEKISMNMEVVDNENGSGIHTVRAVLDPDGAAHELFDILRFAENDLGQGPRRVTGLRCSNANVCDADGNLDLRRLDLGRHVISVVATDMVGQVQNVEFVFLEHDFEEALNRTNVAVNNDAPLGMPPQMNTVMNALVDGLQAFALEPNWSLPLPNRPLLGGSILAAYDVLKNLNPSIAMHANLDRYRTYVARGAASDVQLYNDEVKARFGRTLDISLSEGYLSDAATWRAGGQDAAVSSLLSLEESYFHIRNQETPYVALDFDDAGEVMEKVSAEMEAYLDLDAQGLMPGAEELAMAMAIWDLEVVPSIGCLSGDDPMSCADYPILTALLGMVDISVEFRDVGRQSVWVRNWQWGLVQSVRMLSMRSLTNSADVSPNPLGDDDCEIIQGRAYVSDGQTLLSQYKVEQALEQDFVEAKCLMISVYIRACYPGPGGTGTLPPPMDQIDPACDPAEYGCGGPVACPL